MNTQTQTNTLNMNERLTQLFEQVQILTGRVDTMEAQLSKKSPKKTVKPKRSDEDIQAEKLRKKADAEEKRLAKEAKDADKVKENEEKRLAKEDRIKKANDKKIADAKIKADNKLKAEKEKAENNAKKAAEKLAKVEAAKAKKLVKGPSLDKTFTKKRFNIYRDLKPNDPNNQFKGLPPKEAFLRIAKKKDGSDTTVYRVSPDNWPADAIEHFNSLEDKWDRKSLPFSDNYVAPEPKIKSAKKKAKKKQSIKKTLAEQTATIDTDDELEEQPPTDYTIHRCFRYSPKSSEITWLQVDSAMEREVKKRGLVPLDIWGWMRFPGDDVWNGIKYTEDPIIPTVDKVVEDLVKKVEAETDEQAVVHADDEMDDDDEIDEIEDDDEDLMAQRDIFQAVDEYDSDGYRPLPFGHEEGYQGVDLKITKDRRVFRCEDDKYLGIYNENTGKIDNNSSSEDDGEDDAFGSDNDMGDTAVF